MSFDIFTVLYITVKGTEQCELQTGDQRPSTEGAVDVEQATADEEAERKDSVTEDPMSIEADEKKKQKRKHMRHHHHRRKYSLQEDGGYKSRVRAGSDFPVQSSRRISIQPEEMSILQEQYIDDLTSNLLHYLYVDRTVVKLAQQCYKK